jgi:endonuclease/exonuclease/phosphatase family metal-dependent hydrolase
MELNFLTYNIHKGIGNDRIYSLNRIISVLRNMDADIIALQEVDSGAVRTQGDYQAEIIAGELGMHFAYAMNVKLNNGGGYGNAVISRYPIESWENIDLTWTIKKSRSCLAAVIKTEKKNLLAMNYHLGLAGIERLIQARKLMKAPYFLEHSGLPSVLMGDTNDRSHRLDSVLENHGFTDTCRDERIQTFPSFSPVLRLDKIHYNKGWILREHHVIRNGLTGAASDHLPVMAKFRII